MQGRYFVSNNNLEELVLTLEDKGYTNLPDAGRELSKVIIDTKLKTFWFLDQTCFENNVKIIRDNQREEISNLDPEIIERL